MRKILAMLGAMLLMSVTAIGAMAQDATPAAAPAGGGSAVDPAIGETVTYVDVSGNPIAHVTVENVERNWQGFDEFYEPDPGVEYVAFTITVESVITRGSVEVSDFDFSMQDASGFLWSTAFVQAAPGTDPAPLEDDLALVTGDSATFLVVFEVLQDQPLAHLFWQPDSGRLLTIANLEGV
jgi:hypothetical protein